MRRASQRRLQQLLASSTWAAAAPRSHTGATATPTPIRALLPHHQPQQQPALVTAAAAAAAAAVGLVPGQQQGAHHGSGPSSSTAAAAMAAAAALASLSLASSASCEVAAPAAPTAADAEGKGTEGSAGSAGSGDAVLPMKQVMRLISDGLREFRTQRFLGAHPPTSDKGPATYPPASSASYPKIAVLAKGKGADEPYTIEVPLPPPLRLFGGGAAASAFFGPGAGAEARVLAACLSALQRAGYTLTFHTGLTTPEGTSLSFVLEGGSVAVTSQPAAGPGSAKASLVLYKNDGFTKGDVDAVVDSYKAAWGGEGGAAAGAGGAPAVGPGGPGGGAGILMNFAELLDALRSGQFGQFGLGPDAARDIFGPLLDPPAAGTGGGSSSSSASPSSSSSSSGSAAGSGGGSGGSASVLAPRTTGGSGGGNGSGGFGAGNDPVSRLRKLGAEVFEKGDAEGLDWTCLAGYDAIREEVEDTVVLALQHADAYEAVAKQTRARYESNRPRAVLFEGPPGTGKTLTARIIASRTETPLVFIPTERILSKWYGDSEKNLAKVFEACQDLGGAIIFIDEVDALATSRDSNMHEATRRILSVLLQSIEGFKGGGRNVLICATNRKQDLDAALLSRFDVAIRFDLPPRAARQKVFGRYAKHLSAAELAQLADASEGYSCRDIKEVCENAERRWASKLIRGGGGKGEKEKEMPMSAPPLKEYLGAARARGVSQQPGRHLSV